jgi:hypothetical protein
MHCQKKCSIAQNLQEIVRMQSEGFSKVQATEIFPSHQKQVANLGLICDEASTSRQFALPSASWGLALFWLKLNQKRFLLLNNYVLRSETKVILAAIT